MTTEADTSIPLSSRVVRSEAIIFTEIEDTVVMMDVEDGCYYELNPVAARVWALTESGPRVAKICEALSAEYEVAVDTCSDEVLAFVDRLRRLEVIRSPRRDNANEIGNDDMRAGAETPSASGKARTSSPRRGRAWAAKLAWTTPTIRVMRIEHTQSGDPGRNDYETNNYAPSS